MRIYTHPSGQHYVNAIYGDSGELAGKLYQLHAGPVMHSLRFQDQKVEDGANGLLNEQLLEVLIHRLGVLQQKAPCSENEHAISHLTMALHALGARGKRLAAESSTSEEATQ